jgi:amidase
MSSARPAGSFFVPHDIEAPIQGAHGGPLAGLTAVVKDMYDIIGARTGGGSPAWLAAQKPAAVHAAAVANILDAGATIVGKTVCDEFFYSVTGENAHYGTPTNVRAAGRVPGGSSAGSAAATAAGVCDFALGSDTGGSIRVPASFCGIYGLRPTHGRIDLSGAMPMSPSFDTGGWFASGPGVFRKVGEALLEGEGDRTPVREVLIADDAFAEADPAVASMLAEVLRRLTGVLPGQEHVRFAAQGLDPWREVFRIVQAWEVWRIYGEFIERHKPDLGPGIRERMAYAASVKEADAGAAREKVAAAREQIRTRLSPGTILALPAAPAIAPLRQTPARELEEFRLRTFRLTCIAGISGLPQVTIPAGTVAGCPVGLSFIGWDGADEVLLDLAFRVARFGGATAPDR